MLKLIAPDVFGHLAEKLNDGWKVRGFMVGQNSGPWTFRHLAAL